ncbi:hypothetical protein K0817_017875 [Microbacterium sp. HD4P20]|uniref:hypothetical protein n=1 Tax=Microbacterium sp. HD4P20 TaxID=2864874 RepID=UPI001C63D427|nr:hypothetical protein [Microbacterium sp. HD4P20]MCP2638425.1 hypothetical protein [Microbacterium sp. HD4P20]
MAQKQSLWTRIKNFISPPRESYDSRQARPGDAGAGPGDPVYEATDRRRHGGTMEIGH